MGTLMPAVALAAQLEPYKKLLGVLIRKDCISLALSNPYLNLAEPLGGLMLRDGRLSARALQRMLKEHQLSGFVIGCEVEGGRQPSGQQQQQQQQYDVQVTVLQEQAVQQVQSALASISPELPGGWYGSWSAASASCRILPPGGPQAAAAAAAAGSSTAVRSNAQQQLQAGQQQQAGGASLRDVAGMSSSSSSGGGGEQQRCSLGQQFLQDYLDSLGALNTFG